MQNAQDTFSQQQKGKSKGFSVKGCFENGKCVFQLNTTFIDYVNSVANSGVLSHRGPLDCFVEVNIDVINPPQLGSIHTAGFQRHLLFQHFFGVICVHFFFLHFKKMFIYKVIGYTPTTTPQKIKFVDIEDVFCF